MEQAAIRIKTLFRRTEEIRRVYDDVNRLVIQRGLSDRMAVGLLDAAPILAASHYGILNLILPQVQGGEYGCVDTVL
jgi:hypothetical protein